MNQPTQVKVGATVYTIEDMHPIVDKLGDEWGNADYCANKITISTKLSTSRYREVLLHEIFHCIFYEWDMQPEDAEERTVSAFAFGMLAVMKDNPAVFKWLMK